MKNILARIPLLAASVALIGLSVHAAAPLLVPEREGYLLSSMIAGLVLSALWRWSGRLLAIVTLVAGSSGAFLLWRWLAGEHSYIRASSVLPGTPATGLPAGAAVLLALCTLVLAVCCGRLLFEHRTPWPAVALASSAFLLRANVTRVYEERFPWFLLAAIAVAILCHAAGDRRVRVGLATLAVSVVVVAACWQLPTAIHAWSPALSSSIGRSSGTGIPGGGGDVLRLSGAFHPNNRPVMSVATNLLDVRPYWRTAVFDYYDGHSWSAPATTERIIAANQPVSAIVFSTRGEVVTAVQVLEPMADLASAGVPARASVPVSGQYATASQQLVALHALTPLNPGTIYQVDGTLDRSVGLPADALAPYLQLPGALPRVWALAHEIARAYSTPLLRVLALESYLRDSGRFQYDLQAGSPPDADAVDNFLFMSRRGYCNQFASALVVLARELGLPARLVTGYTTGTIEGAAYLVRERDAHSWVESYIPGTGWISLDPTPGFHADPALITDPRGKLPTITAAKAGLRHPPNQAGGLGWRRRWSYRPPGAPSPPPAAIGSSSSGMNLLLPVLAAGGLCWLLCYLWWPRSLAQLYRGLRRAAPLPYGGKQPADTPTTFMECFGELDRSTAALRFIVGLYIQQQYADVPILAADLRAARRGWRRQRLTWFISRFRPRPRARGLRYVAGAVSPQDA